MAEGKEGLVMAHRQRMKGRQDTAAQPGGQGRRVSKAGMARQYSQAKRSKVVHGRTGTPPGIEGEQQDRHSIR
jgi:hypothetical protein